METQKPQLLPIWLISVPIFFISAHFLQRAVILPIETKFMPNLTHLESIVYLPHAVRILAIAIVGPRVFVALFPATLIISYGEFSPENGLISTENFWTALIGAGCGSVAYMRMPRLFENMAMARLDGRFPRLVDKLARVQLLILDDWGTHSLTDQQRLDLLEIFEERYQRKSTMITAQLPVSGWHEMIGEPTIADAILDRIIHNAHRIELKGESMRKKEKPTTLTKTQNAEIMTT